ncbi:MAG: minor capsid protein [Nitrospinae bacterium]|nr:minor capsid protein [Nitrospinota bacterium]
MLHEAHDRAFTVAKMMDVELLGDVRAALDEAIARGGTVEEFKRELAPHLQARGWWGRQEMLDPVTGEARTVQLGSARRLETIFRTNLRTAHAAGQWERIERNKKTLPLLMYDAINDGRTRAEHRAWDGTVLPVDHPWWKTHYPPNGWNCRCSVIPVNEAMAAAMGEKVTRQAPPEEAREWTNPRTGEVVDVPKGIDPGWGYHPGRSAAAPFELFAEKLEGAPADLAQAALASFALSGAFARWVEKPRGPMPVMRLPDDVADAIGARRRVAVFSQESMEKNRENHGDIGLDDYRRLPSLPTRDALFVQDGDNTVVIVRDAGALYWAAVKATRTGLGLFTTSFRRTNRDDVAALVRRGKVVKGAWQ